jgi:hypothetical protein
VDRGKLVTLPAVDNTPVSDGASLQRLAVAGGGLARLALCDLEKIHAVFLGHGGWVPARVRAFLDFLFENVRL